MAADPELSRHYLGLELREAEVEAGYAFHYTYCTSKVLIDQRSDGSPSVSAFKEQLGAILANKSRDLPHAIPAL